MPASARAARSAHNDALYGVTCTSARHCVAVGTRAITTAANLRPMAQVWTGSRWRLSEEANPPGASSGFLNDVSCDAKAGCLVVGSATPGTANGHAMAGRYAHGRWQVLNVPEPAKAKASELNGISCAGRDCIAVGFYQTANGGARPLAEFWGGAHWRLLSPGRPGGESFAELDSVSCRPGLRCAAAGFSDGGAERPFVETWQDKAWRMAQEGRVAGGALNGITCTSASRCRAVGAEGSRPLAEVWTGSRVQVTPAEHASGPKVDNLNQVACRSGRCVAVGSRAKASGSAGGRTLAERLTGARWRVMTTANP